MPPQNEHPHSSGGYSPPNQPHQQPNDPFPPLQPIQAQPSFQPQPPFSPRMTAGLSRLQLGLIVAGIVLVFGLPFAVFIANYAKDDKKGGTSETSQEAGMDSGIDGGMDEGIEEEGIDPAPEPTTPASGGTALEVNARNTQRKNDASVLAGGVAEYANNNQGSLPTDFQDGWLLGTGATQGTYVNLTHYRRALFGTGAQGKMSGDFLRIILNASCEKDDVVATSSSRSYAVQYALEKTDGSFTSSCVEF